MNYTKQIKRLLKLRKAEEWEIDFVESVSKGRVYLLKNLTESEAHKLLTWLTEFTKETVLDGIYSIAHSIGAISNREVNAINEIQILEYCIMVFSIAQSKPLLEKTALCQLNYMELCVLASNLGDVYLQDLSTKN